MILVYEWIPTIAIGIVLLIVGLRLNGGGGIIQSARLGLIIIGLIVLPWGVYDGWAQLTAGL